jgi:hypothetical protein
LLLGSIPIVKTSPLDPLYKDLPVVIVKDWNECKNPKNLDLWWEKLKTKTELGYVRKKLSYENFIGIF